MKVSVFSPLLLCVLLTSTASPTSAQEEKVQTNDHVGTFTLPTPVPDEMKAFVNRNMEEVDGNFTTQIRHGDKLLELPVGEPIELSVTIDGVEETIDSYMDRYGLASLMVVQDGVIRAEHYNYGNKPSSRVVIQSVTKTFASTALAVALRDGAVRSLDDLAEKYVPELEGSPYGKVPIRDLANMVSGVRPPEGARTIWEVYKEEDEGAVFELLRSYEAYAEPGKDYEYADVNYFVVSRVVENAVGIPIEDYIGEEIWSPAGMQYDGVARTTATGLFDGHGGLNLSLGDMARFGLFVLESFDGQGGPDVPENWFAEISAATTAQTGLRAPGQIDEAAPDFGYQLGWWPLPRGRDHYELGDDGGFAGLGWGGNGLYVVPGANVVIAYQSASTYHSGDLFFFGKALATAIVEELKSNE